MSEEVPSSLGAVVIGRNEGERLRRCLASLAGRVGHLVYVDSGSTDGSIGLARQMGAHVVELDTDLPFTAARARNAGLTCLRTVMPDAKYVQFADGDCEVDAVWVGRAAQTLGADSSLAVVCGRRRERHPDASIYNRLCDMEWNTPVGFTDECGGDALMRIEPLVGVGGYHASLIAGEEPELCLRLRQRGHRILRIDAEMSLHDANITRFGQWWRRTVRSGHAYAEGFALHRRDPERFRAKQVRSNFVWGAVLPLSMLVLLPFQPLAAGLLLATYPVLAGRVFLSLRRQEFSRSDAALYTVFVVIGKVACAVGQLRYFWHRLRGQRSTLIEYKGAGSSTLR